MNQAPAHALSIARPVLRGLTVLNLLYAAGLLALLACSFFIEGWPQRPLGFDLSHAHPQIGRQLCGVPATGAGVLRPHGNARDGLAVVACGEQRPCIGQQIGRAVGIAAACSD